jgi:hypothetical protein
MTGPSSSRQPDAYGGRIHTPTLGRIANQGISCNAVHTGAGAKQRNSPAFLKQLAISANARCRDS